MTGHGEQVKGGFNESSMNGRILSLVASGVAIGLLGAAFPMGSLPSLVATFFAVASFAGAFLLWIQKRSRSKYDLGLLREVHEKEEVRNLEVEEDHDYGTVVCLACQTVYDRRLPACPNCGRAF